MRIAYYVLVLLIGVAAIVYVLLKGRDCRLPFVKPFAWFLGFNNFMALINMISAYACANLLGFAALFRYSVFARFLGPAARISQAGTVYALFAVASGFRGRRLSRAFHLTFGIAAGILLASYVISDVLSREGALGLWLAYGQLAAFGLGVLATLGVLLFLLVDSRKISNAAQRKAVRGFSVSFLSVYAVFVMTFPLPESIQFFPNALALLAINVIPFIWFGKPFAEAYVAGSVSAEDGETLERFCRKHGLTSRESAIFELVLRGRSNAQIEKELFISIHTVKNHITNIYRKLGVRGRWQLLSQFQSGREKRPPPGALG